jgi:hypothetical protein
MSRGQKAWLLRWVAAGDHAAVEDEIAAILPARTTRATVASTVETMYARRSESVAALADYARNPKSNPHRAQWHNDHCYCGHNPSLHANYVENLRVETDPTTGLETVTFTMPPLYELDKATGGPKVVRGPLKQVVQRSRVGPLSDRKRTG